MIKNYKIYLSVLILFCVCGQASASHIIGGQMTYTYDSASHYTFTLRLFRDCKSTTGYDNPAYIGIYNGNDSLITVLSVSPTTPVTLTNTSNNPCASIPASVCVQEADYVSSVVLPPNASGYYIVYQRCCRNASVVNIVNSSGSGATDVAYIPPALTYPINSSPYFKNDPPLVVCAMLPISVDMSAIDANGDSLAYHMWTPFDGANTGPTQPNPPAAPPYTPVVWTTGYSQANQLGTAPVLKIDSITGLLTGYAPAIGLYVVGVTVLEYRHGVLLDSVNRDFEVNATSCTPPVVATFGSPSAAFSSSDTLAVCGSNTVVFTNSSTTSQKYFWVFGDGTNPNDTSSLINPSYTYPDTGFYQVLLYVDKGSPCHDSVYHTVDIRKAIVAAFGFDTVCAYQTMQFTDSSYSPNTKHLTGWSWNFGDGSTASTVQNPIHSYTSAGKYTVTLTVKDKFGCEGTMAHTIVVNPDIHVSALAANASICPGDSTMLSASGAKIYTWQPGNVNDSIITVHPGTTTTYIVTGINGKGCPGFDTLVIAVISHAIINTSSPRQAICPGDTTLLKAIGGIKYTWQPGGLTDSVIKVHPTITTTYTVIGIAATNCTGVDSISIIVASLNPIVTSAQPQTICFGGNAKLSATGAQTYTWQPGHISGGTPTVSPTLTVTYTVTGVTYAIAGKDTASCPQNDTLSIIVHPLPIIKAYVTTPYLLCLNLYDTLSASGADSNYIWQPGNLTGTSVIIQTNVNAVYTVTGTDKFSCADTSSILVRVYQYGSFGRIYDTTIYSSYSTPIYASNPHSAYYLWSPSTTLSNNTVYSPLATPTVTTTYIVQQIDTLGCKAQDTVIVIVEEDCTGVYVPDAFTPNNDSKNDVLKPLVTHDENIELFRVFNRWGQVMFESNNAINGWDGTYKGQKQPTGTYIYYLKYQCKTGAVIEKKGDILLL